MSRLVAAAPALALDLDVAPGEAVLLPDDPAPVAWLRGGHRHRRGDVLRLDGRDLRRRSPAARVRAGLVTIGDVPVAPEVSVTDHLAARTTRRAAAAAIDAVPRLADRRHVAAGVLSGGERRLLAWARAVMLHPQVAVLDRAGTGLDPDALAWATEQLGAWRASGVAVVVRPGRVEEHRWAPAEPPTD